jgi:hypothetical protein
MPITTGFPNASVTLCKAAWKASTTVGHAGSARAAFTCDVVSPAAVYSDPMNSFYQAGKSTEVQITLQFKHIASKWEIFRV